MNQQKSKIILSDKEFEFIKDIVLKEFLAHGNLPRAYIEGTIRYLSSSNILTNEVEFDIWKNK